jgi:hypothetical protein
MHLQGLFDFRVRGLLDFTPEGCERTLWVLIAVQRECISEFYGFRKRRANREK